MSRAGLLAACDLLRRYLAVLRAAWADRRTLAPKGFSAQEAAFLPAALELQEAPLSPLPRRATGLLLLFVLLVLAWSIWGQVDVVAVAPGKVVASGRTKIVQPAEAGVVRAIHVRDGQRVRAGELLIELDASMASADQTRMSQELAAARLDAARWTALLAHLARLEPHEPESMRAPPARADAGVRTAHAAGSGHADRPAVTVDRMPHVGADALAQAQAQALLEQQVAEVRARLMQTTLETERRAAELQTALQAADKLDGLLPVTRRVATDRAALADQGFLPRHDALEHQRRLAELEAELQVQQARIEEARAGLRQARAAGPTLLKEARRDALARLEDAQRRAAAATQEQVKARVRTGSTRLLAPIDGTVQQLAIHTHGGVVTAAQPLLAIVPQDDALEIEAQIENKDIGFVRPGQVAEVKIDTFSFTRYGTLPGRVHGVSGDAIADERRGLVYAARITLERDAVALEDRNASLSPGMGVTVEIKLGTRRVIDFFLSPIRQATQESLRER